MIGLLMALAVQAQPALPLDEATLVTWAKRCTMATRQRALASGGGRLSFAELAHAYYFPYAAAARSPGSQPFTTRVHAFELTPGDTPLADADVEATYSQCAKDSPRSTGDTVGTLPADPTQRTLLCFAVTSSLTGMGASFQSFYGDGTMLQHWQAQQARFRSLLSGSPAVRAAYRTSESMTAALQKAMVESVAIGRLDKVGALCDAVRG